MVSSYVTDTCWHRNCPPTGRAADAIHGQLVLLLRFQQGVFGFFSKNAVRGQPQQPLEHLRGGSVHIAHAAPADRRQDERVVGRAGIVFRCIAEPRRLCVAGVSMYDGATIIPVDTHRLEVLGGNDAQSHRVDVAVFHAPVSRHPITVLAARTAFNRRIMRNTAVAAGNFDGLAQLFPDSLHLLYQLRIHHLPSTPAGAFELLTGEIFAQG